MASWTSRVITTTTKQFALQGITEKTATESQQR